MSKLPLLGQLVKQRIDAAAENICKQFERTVARYEDQLSHLRDKDTKLKLLEAVFNSKVQLHRSG